MLAEIGAGSISEQLVFNKIDLATPETLTTLRTLDPRAVFTSARTGAGVEDLRARVEERLPRPEVEVRALVPYARHDLIDKIHRAGEFLTTEHTAEGTRVVVRVHPDLAGELEEYAE